MPETSIPVQPAGTTGAVAPVPLPLKMVLVPDGSSYVEAQAFVLYDDQGRAVVPLSEATGQQIVRLLTQLVAQGAAAGNGLNPSDQSGGPIQEG